MSADTTLETLAERVTQLEQRTSDLEAGAIDADGQQWTLSDFLSMGLTRRQAMVALASVATGTAGVVAAVDAVTAAPSTGDGDGDVGAPGDLVDVFAEGIAGGGSAIDIGDPLALADLTADPTTNGEIQRNGADVKVHSGGATVNLSGGDGSGLDADSWEGYDLQKNGTDGAGIFNVKT